MNQNIKLFQSALGLGLGLWMIACGGPTYKVINSEEPANEISKKDKPTATSLNQSPDSAGDTLLTSARKPSLRKSSDWPQVGEK